MVKGAVGPRAERIGSFFRPFPQSIFVVPQVGIGIEAKTPECALPICVASIREIPMPEVKDTPGHHTELGADDIAGGDPPAEEMFGILRGTVERVPHAR